MIRLPDRRLADMTPDERQAWWRQQADHDRRVGQRKGKSANLDPETKYCNAGSRAAFHPDDPSGSEHRRTHALPRGWYVQGSLPGHVGEWEL